MTKLSAVNNLVSLGKDAPISLDEIKGFDHLLEEANASTATPGTAPAGAVSPTTLGTPTAEEPSKETSLQEEKGAEKVGIGKLFTLAMFGSLDDFAVQVSLMLAGVLTGLQLVVGVFIGTIIVVIICIGISRFACVVRLIELIPLWCIIGAFATWTYISIFVMN